MNKRQANSMAKKIAGKYDPKNAPVVNITALKELIVFCHEANVNVPVSVNDLLIVKVLKLAMERDALKEEMKIINKEETIKLLRDELNRTMLVIVECVDSLRKAEKLAADVGADEVCVDCKKTIESINELMNL